MHWSKHNYIYKSEQHGYLLFNFLSGIFLDINDKIVRSEIYKIKKNINNYDLSNKQEIYDLLFNYGIICNDDEDNENIMFTHSLFRQFDETNKILTIIPTLNCNLDCTYCYAGKNLKQEYMSNEVLQRFKNYMNEEYIGKVKKIYLDWYGGEPLLAFDIIKDLTHQIKSLNIPFCAGIVTNGILLNSEIIEQLADLNITEIQITLDGIKETHDKKRKFKNGEGTYELIMKNLNLLHSYIAKNKNMHVCIRINVDKNNKDEYHIVHSYIENNFPLFHPYIGILSQYQTCSSNVNCFNNKIETAEYLFEQYEKYKINCVEYKSLVKGIVPCMAECINTDMIGPQGEMYLCLKDVGDEEEIIGSIFRGKTNSILLSEYIVSKTRLKKECQNCKVLYLCGGGCPNHRHRNKKYGENHDICNPIKNQETLKKFLDLHYDFKKNKTKND